MNTSRNRNCDCGSGKRFKECCGSLLDPMARITDAQIRAAVHTADDEGLANNEEPKDRAFKNVLRVLTTLGVDNVVVAGQSAPPIVRRIHTANERLFRREDMQAGGLHLGAYMFRDIFCHFHVPLAFGTAKIDFFEIIDLTDYQKGWLASDSQEAARFHDQGIDLLDFGYGWMEFGSGRPASTLSKELIFRSHVQLEAAAAIATGGGDFRGIVHSSLLGVELSLKAGLAASGETKDDLRKRYGHDLKKAALELGKRESAFDSARVVRSISTFPPFVQSRYEGAHPARLEAGHILMTAQYIASEVTRCFSDRNLRADDPEMAARTYP